MGLSKNIAFRLRTLREATGLSQQEVAERADLSLSLIAKMEQGRKADPRASTILALAEALGVRPGQLIEDLTPPPDGFFPGKGKKGKKKKKKLLAALVGAISGNGIASSHDEHEHEHAASVEEPKKKKRKAKAKTKPEAE